MLSMFIVENQKNQDKYLLYIVYAYNTSVHMSTNETPFYLNHAYNPKQPMWLNMLDLELNENLSVNNYKTNITERMLIAKELAKKYNNRIQEKQIKDSKKTKHETNYKIGELVWLYT